MKWNYRVMKCSGDDLVLCEVYYDEDNKANDWFKVGETYHQDISDMQDMLDKMLQGAAMPVLDYNTGEEIER